MGPISFSDLAETRALRAHWAGLQRDAVSRLPPVDGKVERVTLSKQRLHVRHNDRVLIEMRVESGKRKGAKRSMSTSHNPSFINSFR